MCQKSLEKRIQGRMYRTVVLIIQKEGSAVNESCKINLYVDCKSGMDGWMDGCVCSERNEKGSEDRNEKLREEKDYHLENISQCCATSSLSS